MIIGETYVLVVKLYGPKDFALIVYAIIKLFALYFVQLCTLVSFSFLAVNFQTLTS